MLFLTQKRVNIGVNPDAGPKQRHGVLWIEFDPTNPAAPLRIPFILDKPFLVEEGLNFATWRRLKQQIEKMGIKATNLELEVGKNHFCYELAEYKEIYAGGNTGRPMYTTIPA